MTLLRCIYLLPLVFCFASCNQASTSEGAASETAAAPATAPNARLDELAARMINYLPTIPLDSTQIPRTIEGGKMKGTKSKSWTSGFFPGLLWELYAHSKDERLKTAAENWQAFVEKEKYDGGTHDLGFKLYCSFGGAWKATKNKEYRDVFITASNTLITRYNEKIGALRSWDHHADVWQFPVIIDNMMNLEMLFEATRETGDSVYHKIAEQHALTTLENHFRDDNSSYHVVSYDTLSGQVEMKNTHQGLSHESAWSRGQAWGLYGYGIAYKYTGRQEFLDQATKIADYIFTHPNLPEDLVPYWDYDAPNIPDEPRDVSAAAVAASGLFALADLDKSRAEQYKTWANTILTSLSSEAYQLDVAPFFLQHSVGSIPGKFEMDAPIIYADYYYAEALNRSVAASPTQALLLVQKAPFDVNDKNKVNGAYQARQRITVPSNLTPQNKWIMFEGPVLENDKVAYRYYADSRHRFDIYGKKVSNLVMDTVSWQYHDIMDWGSDILKVGNSLGLGSPAIYFQDSVYALENCDTKTIEVIKTGGDRSMIRTTFKGLLIGGKALDIVQDWSIEAGDYYSTIDLSIPYGKLPEGMHFATGIVSHLPEVTFGSANGYGYLMNWGTQSYHEELLGMAVMAEEEYGPKAVEDELSHLLVFENAPENVSYRFMAVWERDQSKTKDAAAFKAMVEQATSGE